VRKEIDPRRAWIHFVVAFTLVTSGLALSQEVETQPQQSEPSAKGASEEERVIVTGSHIPTAEEVGPNPVLEINRDMIEKSGERTAADLLKRLPIDSFAGEPTFNAGNSQAAGASSVALRGFDASSTLVLLDGRRLAPYPVAGGATGGVTFVDLNSIPKAALGSIEILKDSASSIYGADAVAGVVNLKFRRDYRGAEITAGYGNTLDKDSGEITASGIFGAGDDQTNVTAVLNYYHRNSIATRDRAFSGESFSRNSSPINLQLSSAAVLAAGVPLASIPIDRRTGLPLETFFGHAPFLTNGDSRPTVYIYTQRPSSFFDTNRFSQAVPDSERYGGFVETTHKICGDQLVAYADFFDQKVKTRYELAPSATGPFSVPGQTILAIPPHAPGPIVGGPTYQDTDVPLGAFNPFNPFQQIISGSTQARLAEFGNRINFNQTDAIFSTLGVKGDKLFGGSWGYDAGFRYSEVQNEAMFQGVSASRFNRILNAADAIFDPTSPQFIGTTIPYNPFGDYRRPIASNFLPVDFARVNAKDLETSKLATLDLNVYTTSLFNLPAGGVGLAFGGQFRRETFGQNPDQLNLEGDIIGSTKSFIVTAGRKTYAFYAETTVPIVSSANPIPLIHSLQFTAAGRFEDFRNNNTNVLVPKVGMRWQPFDESFTLRATWGEGFHEPSLVELFGNPVGGTNLGPLRDPVTHIAAEDTPFVTRGNPNLQPEDSRSFSGGFVYTPKFIQGLTLTVDLWDIESTGRAFIPALQNVIDRAAAGKSLLLENVIRDPLTGEITFINLAFQNAGSRKAEGADLGLSYQIETAIGTFTSDTQVTYIESLQFAETSDVPEVEIRANADFVGADSVPLKWKGTSRLDWAWHGVSSGITAYYLDGFHEDVLHPAIHLYTPHYVSQTWLFDVRASYTFNFVPPASAPPTLRDKETVSPPVTEAANFGCSGWRRLLNGTTVTIGCNNVFGQDPPFSGAQGFVHYPQFLYDPTGRFVYASLTKKF
jgi:iron complex outermembrane receptor protein